MTSFRSKSPLASGSLFERPLSRLSPIPVACVLALGAVSAGAQVTSGTILGSVQDTTGAFVPDATVTAAAPALGVTRTVTSTGNGTFSIPNLPAGTYTVTVSRSGFQQLKKDGVILNSADRLNAGAFKLEIGVESQTVSVTAETGQLQIQANSGERSDLITGKQLNDIALNGRNVLDIVRVIPGVSGSGSFGVSGTGGLDSYSVNGTRQNQHEFTIDGASNVDTGNNGGTQVTINTDAIAEVKVLTSNYQAEFGKAGGGSIIVTTRGGTNDFHGNLHFFHRNEGMDARSWIENHNATPLPQRLYRLNTAGAQIGGPIIKDKLFFFFSTEAYRQLQPGSVNQYRVPTTLERAGDFSQSKDSSGRALTIYNPNTGRPFANNQVTAGQLPAGQAANYAQIQRILNLYPQPNVTGIANYNRQDSTSIDHPRMEYIARVDYQISKNERLFGRYINNQDTQTGPFGNFGLQCSSSLQFAGGCTNSQPGWNASLDLTSTLSPTIVNEVSVGPSVYHSRIGGVNGNITVGANNINLPLLFPVSGDTSIPDISYSGNGQNYPSSYLGSTPWHQATTTINANDNLTWSVRSHTLKFGAFYQRARKDQISYGNANGQFSFSNACTSALGCLQGGGDSTQGSPFASALVGSFNNFSQSSARPTGYFRYNQLEFYAQDTWQLSSRFTLDYGVRFVWIPPQYDAKNQIALFSPDAYDPAKAVTINPTNGSIAAGTGDRLNGMTYASNGTLPKGGWNGRGIMYEPRIGFSYDPIGDHKGVVRGGFGISHDRSQGNLVFNTVFGNPSLVQTPSLTTGNITGISTAAQSNPGVLSGIYGADIKGQVPTTYSYSLGIQRQVASGTTLDVAYVGTLSRHQVTARDLNQLPYGTTLTRAAQDPSQYAGGVVPTVEPNLPPEYAAAGFAFSGTKAYQTNYLAPYKGYDQLEYYKFDGTSNYHSLQLSVQRRFSRGLTFGGVYTWSKAMTTSTADESFVDKFNPKLYSYGPAGFDRRHIGSINYVYDLPKFSQHFGSARRFLAYITDGYQMSGLANFQSGNPVRNALYSPANQLTGGRQYSKTPPAYVGVDQLGNLILPTIGQPTQGAPGSIRNDALVTWDNSIFKNFALGHGESGRYIQLRGEFFNILNHTNFSSRNYNANVTLPSYNAGSNTYTPLSITKDQAFGTPTAVRSPDGPGGPRVIQLAAKIYF